MTSDLLGVIACILLLGIVAAAFWPGGKDRR